MDRNDLLKLVMLYHLAPSNLAGPLREWRFEEEQP